MEAQTLLHHYRNLDLDLALERTLSYPQLYVVPKVDSQ
jgi:hypothetical protein